MRENLTDNMQENILNILIRDESNYKLIINSIKSNYFESSYYREIYQKVKFYILKYKKVPKQHIYDLLDLNIKKNEFYKDILDNIFSSEINAKYVVEEFNTFARQQQMKLGILKVAEEIEKGDLVAAEKELHNMKKQDQIVFDFGSHLNSKFIEQEDKPDTINSGITPLDEIGCCPTRGDMIALAALSGYGKSHYLTQLGKVAMMTKNKVLHITLEMSEDKQIQRYIQSCFGISKRATNSFINHFKTDEYGNFEIDRERLQYNLTLDAPDIEKRVNKILPKLPINNLIIKSFPTGSLTIHQLENYIDTLIEYNNFMPDLILIDYPKCMKINNSRYLREELGEIYKQLKGMAESYNTAMAIVAQFNREAKKGRNFKGDQIKWLDESYLQEDFSLINEVAWFLTLNQTPQEYDNKLARIYVTKGRHDVKNLKVLLSQDYNCCQFVLDSFRMRNDNYDLGDNKDG